MTMSAAEVQHILEQRARDLARVPYARRTHGASYLTFRVAEEALAIPVSALLQVLRAPPVAPLPGSALPLVGVTGWRGDLLMVFDISAAPSQENAHAAYVIVLGSDPPVGVRVDEVSDVVEIATSSIQTLSAARAHRAYALGVTTNSMVVVDSAALVNSLVKAEAT